MKIKILLKSIISVSIIPIKYLIYASLLILIIATASEIDSNQDFANIMVTYAGIPLAIICTILCALLIIWTMYDSIKEKYIHNLSKQSLDNKKFLVKYQIIYEVEKQIYAKDKMLITRSNVYDKNDELNRANIKIKKIKEM